jgi:hypothetical protein
MNTLNVGLTSWIIQDGTYEEFEAGKDYRFALEYYAPNGLTSSDCNQPTMRQISADRYEIRAQVLYSTEEVTVIDFGFRAYHEDPTPPLANVGDWLQGEIYLGIDSYAYFESFKDYPDMPDLFYRFHVINILLETTPWIRNKYKEYTNYIERDGTKESFVSVSRTNAFKDDDRHADYILECQLIEDAT